MSAADIAAYSHGCDIGAAHVAAEAVNDCAAPLCRVGKYSLARTQAGIEVVGAGLTLTGTAIARRLEGCGDCYLFCATLGHDVDRLIERRSAVDMTAGYLADCAANIGIEYYCDEICEGMRLFEEERGKFMRARFSCGYSDLPLALQPLFLKALGAGGIGVTLGDGLLMRPFKSVTAVVGVGDTPAASEPSSLCEECSKRGACDKKYCGE